MSKIICPHCGESSGFYTKEVVTGSTVIYYTENGDYSSDQSEMYSHLNHSGGKNAYCSNCHKYIGKSAELISGNVEETTYFM